MRHAIFSLIASLGFLSPLVRAEEASSENIENIDRDVDADASDESSREGRFGVHWGRGWVFLGCVSDAYQCQNLAYRSGYRNPTAQVTNQCGGGWGGGGYPGGYPGGGYPGGYPGGGYPGGYPGGRYPGGYPGGGYPGGHHGGGYPGGHHGGYPGGHHGGGHHGGWGHRDARSADDIQDVDSEATSEDNRRIDARTHGGYGYSRLACYGTRF